MKNKTFLLFSLIFITQFSHLYSEYIILKKESTGKLVPLDKIEHAKIYTTLMLYQFPANTNPESKISEEERIQALENEQIFIQNKLNEQGPYELIFIPTTLYELYILDLYLDYHNRVLQLLDWFVSDFHELINSRNLQNLTQAGIKPDMLSISEKELKNFRDNLKKRTRNLHINTKEISDFLINQQQELIKNFNAILSDLAKDTPEDFIKKISDFLENKENIIIDYINPGSKEQWGVEYLTKFTRDPFTFDDFNLGGIRDNMAQVALNLIENIKDVSKQHLESAHFTINKALAQELSQRETLNSGLKAIDIRTANTWAHQIIKKFSDLTSNPKKQLLGYFSNFSRSKRIMQRSSSKYSYWEGNQRVLARIAHILAQNKSFIDVISELQLVVDQCFGEQRGLGNRTLKRIISLEYSAHNRQEAIIYRGQDPFSYDGKKYFVLPFYTQKYTHSELYYPESYSASFGSSLFGGIFKDTWGGEKGANAFQFICHSSLDIAVRVNKKLYNDTLKSHENIVFIPPYTELAVLFLGFGETFHVRTTAWEKATYFRTGSAEVPFLKTNLPFLTYTKRFGDFFADNTVFIRSTEPGKTAHGQINDEKLEEELITNTNSIETLARETFTVTTEKLNKMAELYIKETVNNNSFFNFLYFLNQEQRSAIYAKLTPEKQRELLKYSLDQDPTVAMQLIGQLADIITIDSGYIWNIYKKLPQEQRPNLYTKLTPEQQRELLNDLYLFQGPTATRQLIIQLADITNIDSRYIKHICAELSQEQRSNLYTKLTPEQQRELLEYMFFQNPTIAMQMISQGADITTLDSSSIKNIYTKLDQEQRSNLYTKLTHEQKRDLLKDILSQDSTIAMQMISQGADITTLDSSSIKNIYTKLDPEQRLTIYAKLTSKQQKELLWECTIFEDPQIAMQLISQVADITTLDSDSIRSIYMKLSPEQRLIIYAKLTPKQQKELLWECMIFEDPQIAMQLISQGADITTLNSKSIRQFYTKLPQEQHSILYAKLTPKQQKYIGLIG